MQRVDVVDLCCPLALATYAELAAAENGALDGLAEIASVGNCACLAHVVDSVLFNDEIILYFAAYVKP